LKLKYYLITHLIAYINHEYGMIFYIQLSLLNSTNGRYLITLTIIILNVFLLLIINQRFHIKKNFLENNIKINQLFGIILIKT
jgi:hypothetical protein